MNGVRWFGSKDVEARMGCGRCHGGCEMADILLFSFSLSFPLFVFPPFFLSRRILSLSFFRLRFSFFRPVPPCRQLMFPQRTCPCSFRRRGGQSE